MPPDAWPMPCPLFSEPAAPSPLPGTPPSLRALGDAVLEWGKTYSGEGGVRGGGIASYKAKAKVMDTVGVDGERGTVKEEEKGATTAAAGLVDGASEDCRAGRSVASSGCDCGDRASAGGGCCDCEWGVTKQNGRSSALAGGSSSSGNGTESGQARGLTDRGHASTSSSSPPTMWETGNFALEMQAPWARRLLDGKKTVETRSYPLPAGLVGRQIELFESQPGKDGVSSVGDLVETCAAGLLAVGRVVFRATEAYETRESWAGDAGRHLVDPSVDGAYGWKGPGSVHGWVVGEVQEHATPRPVTRMRRVFRSLFEVVEGTTAGERDGCGKSKKKKKLKKKRPKRGKVGTSGPPGGEAGVVDGHDRERDSRRQGKGPADGDGPGSTLGGAAAPNGEGRKSKRARVGGGGEDRERSGAGNVAGDNGGALAHGASGSNPSRKKRGKKNTQGCRRSTVGEA